MIRKDTTWPKSNPQKVKFVDLPKGIQSALLNIAQIDYDQSEKKYHDLVAHNRVIETLAYAEIRLRHKRLMCKHEFVEHDKSSGITDNTVVCKECGLNWSDY